MKKKLLILSVFFCFISQANACVCEASLLQAYESFNTTMESELQKHASAIETKNIKQAKRGNILLQEKITQLQELVEKEKQSQMERKQMIFELEKKIQLLK